MITFAKRNLKVFFKDRSAVFFSLLAVLIIIGLYVFFLGDVWVESFQDMEEARYMMDSWIMAGLLAVTSITTTMGAFGIMVEDKSNKISKDFISSPIKNRSIVGGYILGAVIIGIIMSLITMVLAEVYIIAYGGSLMSPLTLLKTFGLILLSTLTNTSIVLFIVSFFRSSNAFATASTIIGTLIGFLTGIYMPVGNLPGGMQWVVKLFPVSHSAALFRQVMMEDAMKINFNGIPAGEQDWFEEFMGVRFMFGDTVLPGYASILILVGTAVLFYGLSLFNMSRKRRK